MSDQEDPKSDVAEKSTDVEELKNEESEAEEPKKSQTKTPAPSGNKTLIIIVAILAVLVIAVGAYASFNYYKDKQDAKSVAQSATPTVIPLATVSVVDKVVDEGVTWLAPQKVADLGILVKGSDSMCDDNAFEYYKVGTMSNGGVIYDITANCGMAGTTLIRAIKNGDTTKVIAQNSAQFGDQFQVNKGIEMDNSFLFRSLLPDKSIVKNFTQLASSENQRLDTDKKSWMTSSKKLVDTKWGDLNLEYSSTLTLNSADQSNPDKTPIIKVGSYNLTLNDTAYQNYEVRPSFLQSDNTLDLTFSMQQAQNNKYDKFATGGCGLGFGSAPIIADQTLINGAQEIGSKGTTKVYTLTDASNKLVQYAYALYKSDGGTDKKSINEFISDVGLAFWTDDYGNTIAFMNADYRPAAECGKPVVYLYPERETAFKVQVGAQMTKTDPVYDGGWTGTAKPNGELTVSGGKYSYLFWEGLGYGSYPVIDFGRMVARHNVETEIRSDLSGMNLNQKEISDFLEFWMPKMPEAKYVRLSWLTNKEMDVLAPMSISPRPQSIIRVFLDFAGSDSILDLKVQNLPKYERSGFTAVEWGGLLKAN